MSFTEDKFIILDKSNKLKKVIYALLEYLDNPEINENEKALFLRLESAARRRDLPYLEKVHQYTKVPALEKLKYLAQKGKRKSVRKSAELYREAGFLTDRDLEENSGLLDILTNDENYS